MWRTGAAGFAFDLAFRLLPPALDPEDEDDDDEEEVDESESDESESESESDDESESESDEDELSLSEEAVRLRRAGLAAAPDVLLSVASSAL
jgi:hypothetical protein